VKRALLLLPLVVLTVRLWLDARRNLNLGSTHVDSIASSAATLSGGQALPGWNGSTRREVDIIEALGRAARSWLPFGPAGTARTRLAELGRAGDRHAFYELRASILATRWLLTPDRALLDEANRALAHDDGELALLQNVHEPSRALSLLALIGLALFMWSAARALAGAQRHALLGALGFFLFVVGLALA